MPIQDITPPENKPPGVNAPGINVPQPTAAEKAAIEAKWAALRDITPEQALENTRIWLQSHPDFKEWLKSALGI